MKFNAKRIFSIIVLTLASLLWGLAFVAQEKVGGVPPFALGFGRSVLATAFLAVIIPIFDKVKKSERRLFSSHGVGLNRFEITGGILSGVFGIRTIWISVAILLAVTALMTKKE